LRASIGLFLEVSGGGGGVDENEGNGEVSKVDPAVMGSESLKAREHLSVEMNDLSIGQGVEARKTPREDNSGVAWQGAKRVKFQGSHNSI
jgi:hypothetical protein